MKLISSLKSVLYSSFILCILGEPSKWYLSVLGSFLVNFGSLVMQLNRGLRMHSCLGLVVLEITRANTMILGGHQDHHYDTWWTPKPYSSVLKDFECFTRQSFCEARGEGYKVSHARHVLFPLPSPTLDFIVIH